jgi:cysteine desulfurase/selenocysteine lyase
MKSAALKRDAAGEQGASPVRTAVAQGFPGPGGAEGGPARSTFDVAAVRRDFPILSAQVHGRPLAYLDNAATTQKPEAVLDALRDYYVHDNANIHRGVHLLSERATAAYEGAREVARRFLNARDSREIIFVRGTTEGINLVAQSYARGILRPGDEIVVSVLEHHSNFVPWKMVAEEKDARLRVVPITDEGELRMDEYERLLSERTRLVSLGHVSNALGTINSAAEIVRLAHARGIPVLLDGAQAVAHAAVDVQSLGCDFYAFSGHKIFGPTGIGVLYGRSELLDRMAPWQGGGDMISSVTLDEVTYNTLPAKFEAGTPDIAGAIGLAAALNYFSALDRPGMLAHEARLLAYADERLGAIPGVRVIGRGVSRTSIASFVMDNVHPHDIGTILDREGIAIRTGHHCCQPLMHRLGVPATARASLAFYNTEEEIDRLGSGLERVREVFG